MNVYRNQLVEIKQTSSYEKYSIWCKVITVYGKTFTAEIKRMPPATPGILYRYRVTDVGEFNKNEVVSILDENDGKQWCYSDNVTRCNCPGVCRNK